MAKAITTAEYQNIIYTECIAILIGPVLEPYHGYSPKMNTQVTQEFSTAASGYTQRYRTRRRGSTISET